MKRFVGLIAAGALFLLVGMNVSRAQEVTYSAGPTTGAQNLQGLGFSWGDINQDGLLDLFIEPNNLIINHMTYFARAVSSGVAYNSATVGSLLADFNGDGYPDLLVTVGSVPPLLYKDSAGVMFSNITATSGDLSTITSGISAGGAQIYGLAAADYNRDGYLDIVWAGAANQNGGNANTGGGPDGRVRLLKGGPSGFVNVGTTSASPVIDTMKYFESWNPAFVDVNNDGYPDLWLPTLRNGINIGVSRSVLFLNDGAGHFVLPPPATDTGIVINGTVAHISAIASAWGDFNNDGIMDLAVSGLSGDSAVIGGVKQPSNFRLLQGNGDGTFTDVTAASGITYNSGTRGLSWGDYNNDGYIDLLQGFGNSGPPHVWRNNGDGTFTDVSATLGLPTSGANSRSCQFIDYDGDGFLDIYVAATGGDYIWHNGRNLSNWIGFKPVGAGHNLSAIGARFTVYTGTRKQIRNIEAGGSGGGTGGNVWANFGIGAATSVDSVTVLWPDGTKQTFIGLPINQYWTVKEGSMVPSVPVLATPANGATGLSSTDTLKWNAAAGALGYHVQVSLDPAFADPTKMAVDKSGLTGTTIAVRLGLGSTYYWRVSGTNAGFTSAYSAAFSFSTAATPASVVPTLIAPANGAQNQPGLIQLVCGKTTDAAQYNWQVSTLLSFAAFSVNDSTTDTTNTVQLVAGRKYYWRVRGVNGLGASNFSAIDTFTVMTAPAVPALVSPANNAVNQRADTLKLVWRSVSLASGYVCEVARVGSTTDYTVTDTTLTLTGLQKLTNYTWKVQAFNIGGSSLFSGLNSFTTIIAAPAAPTLLLPAANAQGVNRLATFVWNSSVNADKYHHQVARDNAFTNVVRDTVIGFDTTLTLTKALDMDSLFYWRVSALNIGGEGSFSSARAFTCSEVLAIEPPETRMPVVYALHQNYPNPFNPSTMIQYDIPKSSYVSLKIYDVLGRVVASLVEGIQPASTYKVLWNASTVSSGVYFLRIQARSQDGSGNFTAVRKLLLMK